MCLLRFTVTAPLAFLLLAGCSSNSAQPTGTPAVPTFNLQQVVHATVDALTAQATPLATATPLPPTSTPVNASGSISGTLTYPADTLPSLYVAALQVGTRTYQYVITQPGQATYEIDDLPPGSWNIIAYTVGGGAVPGGLAGGYTKAVPCGLAAECADHSLINVVVSPGQHVNDINPGDWYAPPGTFPPFPAAPALTAAAATGSPTGLAITATPSATATP